MTSRTRLLALSLLAAAPVPVTAAADDAPDARRPAAAAPAVESDLTRVFRFHAAAQAEALRDAVESAEGLTEPLRVELLGRVRDYLNQVDEEAADLAATVARTPSAPGSRTGTITGPGATTGTDGGDGAAAASRIDQAVERGVALSRGFNDGQIARWLDENPSAYQPVQEQIALAEAYQRAAADEPEAIVRAAKAAGLPAAREPELRQSLTDIQRKLRRWHDGAMQRLAEAEKRAARAAGLPPPPEPPPEGGANVPPNDLGTGPESGASREVDRPDPLLEKLPPAQRERLQTLSLLTEAEVHWHGVTAGRDARAAAERLLPMPSQRAALKDELLRWYEGHTSTAEEPAGAKESESLPVPQRNE